MNGVTIEDSVYGTVPLDDPLLQRLLATDAIQRLRGVSQSGITGLMGLAPDFSRYEHSVGVLLLLRYLGASRQEQIAGLLHDVSHTAFSHVVDYVHDPEGRANHSYHEQMWPTIVEQSAIPAILADEGYDWRTFDADGGHFTLLEQPSPKLCADRVDYFLRTVVPSGMGTLGEVRHALRHLCAHAGEIVVDDVAVARWMADLYLRMDQAHWANPREVGIYWVLARAMGMAVALGYIGEREWYWTDRELLDQLLAIPDAKIRHLLSYLRDDVVVRTDWPERDFVVRQKLRTIDPPVLTGGQALPLSTLDADYRARREAYLATGDAPLRIWVTVGEQTEVATVGTQRGWEIFKTLGDDAVSGKFTNASVNHDRYLYGAASHDSLPVQEDPP